MKILFLSAEVAPFKKTGGLGDVGGTLPKALKELGHDVRVVMHAYSSIEESIQSGRYNLSVLPGQLFVPVGHGQTAGIFQGVLPDSNVPIYFIAERNLFDRGRTYGFEDDPYRFSFFSRAALELAVVLDWRPDLVHAHDWHTSPAVTWLATSGQSSDFFRGIPSLFTIHNLAHQGNSEWEILNYLGVRTHSLHEEAKGEVNFMARGIYHATLINTVSPTYSKEIKTGDGGAGLDGLLRYRGEGVHGILNGLDYDVWNPKQDIRLPGHFDFDDLDGRAINKRELQAKANLPQRDDIPLIAMISRLDWQKGLDIAGHVLHLLLNGEAGEAQVVVLGTGSPEYESMLAHMAGYHQDTMKAFLEYNAGLAAMIYAGSDMFLMPSLFEPCGLGQLISMRYGSVPIVRETGGLADTVQDGVTGFTFKEYATGAFWNALSRAMQLYQNDKEGWHWIQQNGMMADFSWHRSAQGYDQLYRIAVGKAE